MSPSARSRRHLNTCLRYAREDGFANWWKEILADCREYAEQAQWRRLYWTARELQLHHECEEVECGEVSVCRRCYVLTQALWLLDGHYWRYSWDDPQHAVGYSHGRLPGDAVPARPSTLQEAT